MFGFLGNSPVEDVIESQNRIILDWRKAIAEVLEGEIVNIQSFRRRSNDITRSILNSLKLMTKKQAASLLFRQKQIQELIDGKLISQTRGGFVDGKHPFDFANHRNLSGMNGQEERTTYELFHKRYLSTLAERDYRFEEQAFARMSAQEQSAYMDSIGYSRQLAAKESGALSARTAGEELLKKVSANARMEDPNKAFWGSLKDDLSLDRLTGKTQDFFKNLSTVGKIATGIAAVAVGGYVLNSVNRARGR